MPGLFRKVVYSPPVQQVLNRLRRGPIVYCLHGIEEKIIDGKVQSVVHLEREAFERALDYAQPRYRFISVDELWAQFMGHAPLDPDCLCLTFDDGYRNNLIIAADILNRRKLPFAVFVSTRYIDEQARFPFFLIRLGIYFLPPQELSLDGTKKVYKLDDKSSRDRALDEILEDLKNLPYDATESVLAQMAKMLGPERLEELRARFISDQPLTWDEVRTLKSMGVIIGAHSHDHGRLNSAKSPEFIEAQIRKSKQRVIEETGSCEYFAYPYGGAADICEVARQAVASAGFRLGFTTVRGEVTRSSDPFLMPRYYGLDSIDFVKDTMDFRLARRRWYGPQTAAIRATQAARDLPADEFSLTTRAANTVRRIFMIAPFESALAGVLNRLDVPGLARLAPNHYQYTKPTPRTAVRGGLSFRLDLREYHDWRVYFSRHNPLLMRILDLVSPGDVVLDIGANIGEFALMSAQRVGPEGKIFAFEPFPPNLARLRANVWLNPGLPVAVMPFALSDSAANLSMRVADGLNFGTASVREGDDSGNAVKTESRPLDDVDLGVAASRVSLMKIDVEGWELHVLRGAEQFLKTCRPRIVLELVDSHLKIQGTSAAELVRWLGERGFVLRDALSGKLVKPTDNFDDCELDVLAVPAERTGA